MREIRGWRRETAGHPESERAPSTVRSITPACCEALFGHWRLALMGSLDSGWKLPQAIAGYFFEPGTPTSGPPAPVPVPLGLVRRRLVGAIGRTELTDEERTVVDLYYGMNGLPLPFASRDQPDIADGRHESSPRGTAKAALAKIARQLRPRLLPGFPDDLARPMVDPTLEHWFRSRAVDGPATVRLVAKGYTRAIAQCDGPYAPATLAALHKWYRNCGHADTDLLPPPGQEPGRRPNRNGLARAAALMEIALYEELNIGYSSMVKRAPPAPVPSSADRAVRRLPETVTVPQLVTLLDDDLSPRALIDAALVLKERSLSGDDVTGQTALFLRCVRPRLHHFRPTELEHLATAISYLAIEPGNPFLAMEWLGHFLGRVGITDRTFTVLVNASEAASIGGYHRLADRIHRLFGRLFREWRIPGHQIPLIERLEAQQQRLMADGFRQERLAVLFRRDGRIDRAEEALDAGVKLAIESAGMAHRILTDDRAFPAREIPGKASAHGGDLEWTWALASARRLVMAGSELRELALISGRARPEVNQLLAPGIELADRILSDVDQPPTNPRFLGWVTEIAQATDRLRAQ